MLFVGLIVVMTFVVAWVYGFLDSATADADAVRRLPKGGWMALTFLLPTVGSLAWFALGRPLPRAATGGAAAPRNPAPTGPDDDAEFQRALRERIAEQRRRAEEQKRSQGEQG